MYCHLPRVEIWAYFSLWTGGIAYSVYHVYIMSQFFETQLGNEDLASGWSLVGHRKDIADYEWRIWLPFMMKLSPWLLIHFLTSELLRWWRFKELLRLWYVLITTAFLFDFAGPVAFIFLVMQPCMLLIASQVGGHLALWTTSLSVIVALNFLECNFLSEEQQVILFVSTAWLHLRSLSFCTDLLNDRSLVQPFGATILQLLSFTFYLPLMFLGPFVMYQKFQQSMDYMSTGVNLWARVQHFILNFARFCGWMLLTEWALHFIYCNALQAHPEVLPFMNAWALNGLAYCSGQFFLNKYVVIYGLMGTVAQLDGIQCPPIPRCIAHVSLYSDMWRYFDHGFYNFLKSYVYIPLVQYSQARGAIDGPASKKDCGSFHRLWCSACSFVFVYVWHGLSLNILVWSICNFIGLTVETMGKTIAAADRYKKFEKNLSPENIRRWHAAISSPLFVMSALTTFYFLGGTDVGNVFVLQVINGSLLRNCLLLFFAYCMSQVSIETKMILPPKK